MRLLASNVALASNASPLGKRRGCAGQGAVAQARRRLAPGLLTQHPLWQS